MHEFWPEKEGTKFLFIRDMITYIEEHKNFTERPQNLITKFSNTVDYKDKKQNLMTLHYSDMKLSNKEIRPTNFHKTIRRSNPYGTDGKKDLYNRY